jgi:hypothetical protein
MAIFLPGALAQAKERKDEHHHNDQTDQINQAAHSDLPDTLGPRPSRAHAAQNPCRERRFPRRANDAVRLRKMGNPVWPPSRGRILPLLSNRLAFMTIAMDLFAKLDDAQHPALIASVVGDNEVPKD